MNSSILVASFECKNTFSIFLPVFAIWAHNMKSTSADIWLVTAYTVTYTYTCTSDYLVARGVFNFGPKDFFSKEYLAHSVVP